MEFPSPVFPTMAAYLKLCVLCGILFIGAGLVHVVFCVSQTWPSIVSFVKLYNTGNNARSVKMSGQTGLQHESVIQKGGSRVRQDEIYTQKGGPAIRSDEKLIQKDGTLVGPDVLIRPRDRQDALQGRYDISEQSTRNAELSRVMDGYMGSEIAPDNKELIRRIQDYFIDPPRPYVTKFSMPLVQTPQAKEVDRILKQQTEGFFVECGALDGERSSNTIWLEQKRDWKGLLVEMDPSYYLQVRGKNRKSFSVNACLSPETYPTKMEFKEHRMGEGRLVTDEKVFQENPHLIFDTYCFPLYSLMLALNRTRIDYFSLDVEGMELPILKSIPFDKLDIAVLTVEYKHGASSQGYLDFMTKRGYTMVKTLNFVIAKLYLGGKDFVFVRDDLL